MMSLRTLVWGTHSTTPCSSLSGTTEYVRISGLVKKVKRITELPSVRVRILFQQLVDNSIEFHQTCVFSQVILGFHEKRISDAIASSHGELARLLHRIHNLDFVLERSY